MKTESLPHTRGTGPTPEETALKARLKATWETGDFGKVAEFNIPAAEEFMRRLSFHPRDRVLDVACGTGNLAVIAARAGCITSGVDIASNLIAQAKARAAAEGLQIDYREGDAEALPYADGAFDTVVSPKRLNSLRLLKPGPWPRPKGRRQTGLEDYRE